jgi:acetyltransferase
MNGIFLVTNEPMLKFVQELGFTLSNDPEEKTLKVGVLPLQS